MYSGSDSFVEEYLARVLESVYARSGLFPLYVVLFRTAFNEVRQVAVLSDSQLKQVRDALRENRYAYHTLALKGILLASTSDIESASIGVYGYRMYIDRYRRVIPLHYELDKALRSLESGRKRLIEELREDLELSKPFNDLDGKGAYLALLKAVALVELLNNPCSHLNEATKLLFELRNYVDNDIEIPPNSRERAIKQLEAVVSQCVETRS